MKKILIVHTGGTIGSTSSGTQRVMTGQTVQKAKMILTQNFGKSKSQFARYQNLLEDANFPLENTTLSESMTIKKLNNIFQFLMKVNVDDYAGIILLHGTDTLAFSASLMSFALTGIGLPVILVSGNRPPNDERSNANANFLSAVELIWQGLAPNVYVTYRNSDGIVRLYLASCIMQCRNFSEDFESACKNTVFEIKDQPIDILNACEILSKNIKHIADAEIKKITALSDKVLMIYSHVGLDYSVYENAIKSGRYLGVVHGTYHSGTLCLMGDNHNDLDDDCILEQEKSKNSILYLTKLCKEAGVPLVIAPSLIDQDQYQTMFIVQKNSQAILRNMTTESAYAKTLLALSCGYSGDRLKKYIETKINNEII